VTLTVIVLAGGIGARFSSEYTSPKPLIHVHGHTQLFWASKGAFLSYTPEQFIFACRTELVERVSTEVRDFSFLRNYEVLDVGESTEGPAHTVELALRKTGYKVENSRIVVVDNDCLNLIQIDREYLQFPFVTTTFSNNPGHCFLDISSKQTVIAFHEKTQKGNIVVSGNYGFFRPKQFLAALELMRKDARKQRELYLSTVMRTLLPIKSVAALEISDYFSMGTPAEIASVSSKIGKYL
jgi:hypothetical protein